MDLSLPSSLRSTPVLSRPTGLILLVGLGAMYLPTYWRAASTFWQTEAQFHGVIILGVVAWLVWRERHALLAITARPAPGLGWPCFILGALGYVVGRSQDISIFELGSQIPVLLGSLLILAGRPAVRALRFPLFYLIFMIPLPGVLVDAATGPLKRWISLIAENVLYAFGYPIARSGVVLAIGQYQLLVADACSGLHSLYSLSALGALFMYLMARSGWTHNALLLASILPIAFGANVLRVLFLVLLTYHFGDAVGQGFLHGAAGLVLVMAALLFFFLLDAFLERHLPPRREASRA